MGNTVHVIGTGTIGEPLIGLLADNKKALGIDEVTFHKRTPLPYERAKVMDMTRRGAVLAVDDGRAAEFEAIGLAPRLGASEAIARATVVIDCTPAGNANKAALYSSAGGPKGFIAQGSEHGFGLPYAVGINDAALRGAGRFVQVASCNTHNLCALLKALALDDDDGNHLVDGRFVCMRRSSDVSQDEMAPGPTANGHKDKRFGTHHARDAHGVFGTLGHDLPIWSSAMEMPTQYMHCVWFSLILDREMTSAEALGRLAAAPRMSMTKRTSANQVFSFGRDHGYFGRLFSQAVVVEQSVTSRGREVVGFCFTPQDGNSLLSSLAATLWFTEGDTGRAESLMAPYLFKEV
jgi:glyceraldehyde-3-phosphate dehydrogenase (NAD(P))